MICVFKPSCLQSNMLGKYIYPVTSPMNFCSQHDVKSIGGSLVTLQADELPALNSVTDLLCGNVTVPQLSMAKSEARAAVAPNQRAPTAGREERGQHSKSCGRCQARITSSICPAALCT